VTKTRRLVGQRNTRPRALIPLRCTSLWVVMILLVACGESDRSDGIPPGETVVEEGRASLITTSINDRKESWQVWDSQSDWNGYGGYQTLGTASIYSRAVASDQLQRGDVLSIGFTLTETADGLGADLIDISVKKRSAGSGSFGSENDGTARISIQSATKDGESMHIIGDFSGTLPFQNYGSRDADLSNVLEIEGGHFDVVLAPLSR